VADEQATCAINMAYTDEMKRQGSMLFRLRSYFPLVFLLLLPFAIRNSSYFMGSPFLDQLWELLCFIIALSGLAIRIFTVGFVADGTSGRTTSCPKATELNTTGMYSIVRHPLYLANLIILIGLVLFTQSILLTASCTFGFILYYERIIVAEEAFLKEKFNADFTKWASNTPAMIPRFKLWKNPCRPFSWQSVLKREYSGFLTITASFAILDALIDRFREGIWQPDWFWVIVFCVGFLVFIIFWTLRKMQVIGLPENLIIKQSAEAQNPAFINPPGN
jgi:protein-S-isoprenylcysteine O-methyltransferase Ste14